MSKRKGRVFPTDLVDKTDEGLESTLKEEKAKGRDRDKKRIRDLERALKEPGLRNKDKARRGRREPKKPKRLRDEELNTNRIDDANAGESKVPEA